MLNIGNNNFMLLQFSQVCLIAGAVHVIHVFHCGLGHIHFQRWNNVATWSRHGVNMATLCFEVHTIHAPLLIFYLQYLGLGNNDEQGIPNIPPPSKKNDVPKPHQLAPFKAKEQGFYSEAPTDVHTVCCIESLQLRWDTFCREFIQAACTHGQIFFLYYSKCMAIDEGIIINGTLKTTYIV